MEEGKKYGRLSEEEAKKFIEGLGKWRFLSKEFLKKTPKNCPPRFNKN
jgi:hypothetical protein